MKKTVMLLVVVIALMAGREVYAQETAKNPALEAIFQEGAQAFFASDFQTARAKWEAGLTQAQAQNEQLYISRFVNGLGVIQQNLGDYQQAITLFEQAIEAARASGNRAAEWKAIGNLGGTFYLLGQYDQATTYSEQALTIARDAQDRAGEASALGNLGNIYNATSAYAQAKDMYEQVLTIARELKNRRDESLALGNLGQVYDNLGDYPRAIEYLEQSLAMKRELGDRYGEVHTLANLGNVALDLAQYPKATEYYEQALVLARELSDRPDEGAILDNLGGVARHLGQYDQALEYHVQALSIQRAIQDRDGEKNTLNNIGAVYYDLGQMDRAAKFYTDALTLSRDVKDRQGEATILHNLGLLFADQKDFPQAITYYEQALTLAQEIGDRPGEGDILINLGVVYMAMQDDQRAAAMYTQALTIKRELGDHYGEGRALTNLGLIYYTAGRYQDAGDAFQKSLDIHAALGVPDSVWRAQRGLASVSAALQQPETAITQYEQALATIETLRAGLRVQGDKIFYMQDKLYVYDEMIDLLYSLHQNQPDKGYDRKALEIFERKQGRVFLEQIGKSGARRFAGLPETIAQQESELNDQFDQTRAQLAAERAKPLTDQDRDALQTLEQREKTLLADQAALQTQIKTEYPNYYQLKYPQPVTLEELQTTVLQPDELLLIYGVTRDRTFAWMVSPDEVQMFTVPFNEADLTKHVIEIRQALAGEFGAARGIAVKDKTAPERPKTRPFAEVSYRLYQALIPEVIRPLLDEQHRLQIVPTSALYALPFEMLLSRPASSPAEAHYFVEDIPINYLSSASLLKTLRDAKIWRKTTAQHPLLAFADPVYDAQAQGSVRGLDTLRVETYNTLMRGGFTRLPETADEVKAIATVLGASEQSEPVQLREQANREKLMQLNAEQRLDDYEYLVFATHGILPGDIDRVAQPALVLSYPEQGGLLTMSDVFQLQLNAKLVSLSACNTGMGVNVDGEGVLGLTRAFMYAGTSTIAVTLWSVESLSAKELDIGLFEALKAGESPAQALRTIKLRMLRGEKGELYRHPYFWAPFVLFGDGR